MASGNIPRVVVVTRLTEYESLIQTHGTRGQAEFFLKTREQKIDDIYSRNQQFSTARGIVQSQIPVRWRRASIDRSELDRFVFESDDIIICLGPDGLVPNVAKYLESQVVIGINPHPDLYDGILASHSGKDTAELLAAVQDKQGNIQKRTMVRAGLDDGQSLVALNEIYMGHQTHQSARYDIEFSRTKEFHSSSGLICATGTGATGWGKSIHRAYHSEMKLPCPEDELVAFFVREAFPSHVTGTTLTEGVADNASPLAIYSRMESGGVIFGDGIESDYLNFRWGQKLTIEPAQQKLHLLVG